MYEIEEGQVPSSGPLDQFTQGQIYPGSKALVEKMQKEIKKKSTLIEVPRAQRRALVMALADYAQAYQRDEAIAIAYLSGQHTMAAIADYFWVHYTTMSRLVKLYEEK